MPGKLLEGGTPSPPKSIVISHPNQVNIAQLDGNFSFSYSDEDTCYDKDLSNETMNETSEQYNISVIISSREDKVYSERLHAVRKCIRRENKCFEAFSLPVG